MNILITSAGRRSYLVRYFKEALAGKGLVHAANSTPVCAAFLEADRSIVTPLIYDARYIDFLLAYCQKNSIRAVVPVLDIDVPVLTAHRGVFEAAGVSLVASSESVARTCNDKWITFSFLQDKGFNVPRTYLSIDAAGLALSRGDIAYPVIVKPRFGMASIGLFTAENMRELEVFYAKAAQTIESGPLQYESARATDGAVLIQEKLIGPEYGLDVVNDFNGAYVACFTKKKLAMRAGETDAAMLVQSDVLEGLAKALSSALAHAGNLDVDVFLVGNEPYVLELNPRFGGGYPFAHLAGADLPRAIIHWLEGKPAPADCFSVRCGTTGIKTIEPRILQSAGAGPGKP